MHLYNKAIASISWPDIERFCEQGTTENTYLEYKVDFPVDLAKPLAAMANTFGGLILIGVDETDAGIPRLPLTGIEAQRGLEERVLNTILDSMTPPVIPEIAICLNGTNERAILVIRVPQSEHAPHALHRNSAVYIRTGKRNKPEDIADLERIDWLRDHRKKADDLREWLFSRACMRFRELRDGNVGDVPGTDEGRWLPTEEQPGLLTIALCPMYPDRVLVQPSRLDVVRRAIRIRDYMGTGHEFPLQESGCISRMVEDGFVMHFSGQRGLRTYHTHLNMHGLFLYRQSLLYQVPRTKKDEEDDPGGNPQVVIRGYEILARLYEVVESGAKFYSEIGYWGPLKFRLRLEGLLGIPMLMPVLESGNHYRCFSADHQIDTAHFVQSSNLVSGMHEAVLPLFERVGWAFNSHVTLESLKAHYSYMKHH